MRDVFWTPRQDRWHDVQPAIYAPSPLADLPFAPPPREHEGEPDADDNPRVVIVEL